MAKTGERKQSKRLSAQKSIKLNKKDAVFVARTRPGPHKKKVAMPLITALRELAGAAANKREGKKILTKELVRVDRKTRRDPGYTIGLFDCITIGKESYEALLDRKGRIVLEKLGKERTQKLCKITTKKAKKGKIVLGTHDGRTLTVDKTNLKQGDSIILNLEKNAIDKEVPLEKGTKVFIAGGRHVGRQGKIKELIPGKHGIAPKIRFEDESGKTHETIKEYVYATEKVN